MSSERKDSLLNKMKKAKSFLNEKPKEKTELKRVEISIDAPTEASEDEIKLQKTPPPTQFNTVLSAKGILYRREEEEWEEITEGRFQVKSIPGKGLQLIFILDNTRIILNMLIEDPQKISRNADMLVFTGIEQKLQICTRGISLNTDEEAERAEKIVLEALKENSSGKKE